MKKILIENGCYDLRNIGDVAMLQVAVKRLNNLWPDALIEVVTNAPQLLAKYCPGACPISATGRYGWFRDRGLPSFLTGKRRLIKRWRQIRSRWPGLALALIKLDAKLRKTNIESIKAFHKTLHEADMVVVSGGGDVNDEFAEYAGTLLDVLKMSIHDGKSTIMFGQGIGPIHNPALKAKAKSVLPAVDTIAIREGRCSRYVLEFLGVKQDHIIVTGDDAVETAYQMRPSKSGQGIGVNLRLTKYSQADHGHIEIIRCVLQIASVRYKAPLIALPVSFAKEGSDVETLRELFKDCQNRIDNPQNWDGPANIIKRTGRCRVVVTGSYHSAVFALSQGIPAVTLAKSPYYLNKFLGLSEQFGCGCEVILLDDKQLQNKLLEAIDTAWESSEKIRGELLGAARCQIARGRLAYEQIHKMIESKEIERSTDAGQH